MAEIIKKASAKATLCAMNPGETLDISVKKIKPSVVRAAAGKLAKEGYSFCTADFPPICVFFAHNLLRL